MYVIKIKYFEVSEFLEINDPLIFKQVKTNNERDIIKNL